MIGPTFQFDVDEINFDVVSYGNFLSSPLRLSLFLHFLYLLLLLLLCTLGFPSVQQVSLTNTSEVPMTYSLRVPAHGGKVDEFVINPDRGILPPSLHQNIIVSNYYYYRIKSAILIHYAHVQ